MNTSMWRARWLVAVVALASPLAAQETGARAKAEARAVTVPSHDIEIVTPVPGVIEKMLVKEGDRVGAKDPLVQLDARVQKAALAISEQRAKSTARIESAQANLRIKGAAYKRQQTLHKRGVASDAELEEAELELKHAESLLTSSQEEQDLAKLEAARDRVLLERMTIRAPLAGAVTRTLLDVGGGAEEGEPIVHMVVLDELHVLAYVPPAIAARLKLGATAQLRLDEESNVSHKCTVLVVDPVVDAGSTTCRIKLTLPNRERRVMAGSRGTVTFDLSRPPEPAR
ncbi:efflux RND transporter periplasmic adaptor subunit [bacterium]|nr:efflux RND transporter periplasmic adaptor subunit [bacterium]